MAGGNTVPEIQMPHVLLQLQQDQQAPRREGTTNHIALHTRVLFQINHITTLEDTTHTILTAVPAAPAAPGAPTSPGAPYSN